MKFISTVIAISSAVLLHAQTTTMTARPLRKVLTLTMPKFQGDEMAGTRGASVAWHPLQKKYYAAMAGNPGFPMGIFDARGKRLSTDSSTCEADVRGLWYNPEKKTIQGNSYAGGGWFSYDLTKTGQVKEIQFITDEMTQPTDQCVGAFNSAQKEVFFLKDNDVVIYSFTEQKETGFFPLHWGRTEIDSLDEEEDEDEFEVLANEDYNNTTIVFTGIKGAELGVLKYSTSEIELYNRANGLLTRRYKLPEGTAVYNSFNFAYCNGMFWLFNIETRKWTGFK